MRVLVSLPFKVKRPTDNAGNLHLTILNLVAMQTSTLLSALAGNRSKAYELFTRSVTQPALIVTWPQGRRLFDRA
jgi:hypothetical protein